MAIGLGVSIVAMTLFASAQGTAWLFAARAVQGVAVGAMSGTASAALVELEPDGDRARAAMVATLAQAGGSGLGALVGGVLAQYAADPLVLPFVVWSVVVAICIVAVLRLPEPAVAASGRWSIRRPSVPAEIRRGFARASLSAGAVWAVGALFLSLVPSYAGELLDTDNLAVLGALGGVMLGASCVTQIVGQRRAMSPARAQPLGLVVVMAGLVLLVLAFPAGSLALILGSALLTGAGHGFTFLGAQADINDLAPPERRGEVTAAFATAVYLCVALPVVGLGPADADVLAADVRRAVLAGGRRDVPGRRRVAPAGARRGAGGGVTGAAADVPEELEVIAPSDAAAWDAWLAGEPRAAARRLAQDRQEGHARRVGDQRRGGRRRAVLGLDLRPPQGARRHVVPAALHAPAAGSNWSAVNVAKVEALTAAGRMRPPGLAEVEAAKADGRWARARLRPAADSTPQARCSSHASQMAVTWRMSVPQQPPRMCSCGSASPSAAYCAARSTGSPSSSSSASSSSAWLRTGRVRTHSADRDSHGPPSRSASAKWLGCAQLIMK